MKLYDKVKDGFEKLMDGDISNITEAGRKVYDSLTLENMGKATRVGGFATLMTLLALGNADCTIARSKDKAIHDSKIMYDISPAYNLTEAENSVLFNLSLANHVQRAFDDYVDPKTKLKDMQWAYVGVDESDIGDEFDFYKAVKDRLEEIDKATKTHAKGVKRQKIRELAGLEDGVESEVENLRNVVMNYAMDEAKTIISNELICGELYLGTPLDESYASLRENIIEREGLFNEEQRKELTALLEDVYKKVKSGELKPNIADRIGRELFAIPYGITQGQPVRGFWTGAPVIEYAGIGGGLGEEDIVGRLIALQPETAGKRVVKKMKKQGLFWGIVETAINAAYYVLPFLSAGDRDKLTGSGSGRDSRTGGDDVGRGR